MQIKPYESGQLDAVVRLSLRAWTPVFDSLREAMNPDVYREFYPDGWRASQQKAVEETCAAEDINVWVAAVDDDSIAGFVAVRFHSESNLGEIYMIAVDSHYQRQGVGTALTEFALEQMKTAGMSIAMVETGGDVVHATARRTYEKLGFGLLPIARYFKKL
jgi:ribosomal protein S18 acetylase RimI-like enzyme